MIVDQYNGEILKVYDSGTGSAGDILLDWQWPLHSGHAFGWPGRILVLLSGWHVLCCSAPVSSAGYRNAR